MAADLSAAAIGDLGIPARATWNWLGVTMYLQPEAGFSGIELFDASRLRDRYLRDRPDLPLPGTALIAVATA